MNHWGGIVHADSSYDDSGYDVVCDTCDRKIAYADWLQDAYETWRLHVESRCEMHPDREAVVVCNRVAVCSECLVEAVELYYEAEDPPDEEEARFL